MSMRMGVNGLDHNHVFEIVDRLVKAGSVAAPHTQEGGFLEAYEGWQKESRPVTFDDMLADDSIDIVVTAAIPITTPSTVSPARSGCRDRARAAIPNVAMSSSVSCRHERPRPGPAPRRCRRQSPQSYGSR